MEPFHLVEGAGAKGPGLEVICAARTCAPTSFTDVHGALLVIPNETHVAALFIARANGEGHFGDVRIGIEGEIEAVGEEQVGPQVV